MKQLAFLFVLLFAMTVYAQESPAPQDSYVDKPQHVEYPSANQPQYAPAPQYGQPQYAPVQYQQYPAQYAQPQYAQPQYAPAQYPVAQPQYAPAQYPPQYYQQVFYDDSTAIYQNLIETNTASGNSKRSSGKAMMLGGGLAFGIGGIVMLGGLLNMSYGEDVDNSGAAVAYLTGLLVMTAGEIVFTVGLVNKIIGSSRLRKAKRYQESLNFYNMRKQQSLQLHLVPIINPANGTYGGNLAFNF